ncbi:MAG: hypothetical protein JST36_09450 [Bacteroidetes bacterium]|nr:hypothetical protein [Bacteroidota bacterium]
MNTELLHILDNSVCLTSKQAREYLAGSMLPIESHAVEMHLNVCPLCRIAIEGFEEFSLSDTKPIEELSANFLKEHFDRISPQIHLNTLAPSVVLKPTGASKSISAHFWRSLAIASSVLLAFGVLWYFEFKEPQQSQERQIAEVVKQKIPTENNNVASSLAPTETLPNQVLQKSAILDAAQEHNDEAKIIALERTNPSANAAIPSQDHDTSEEKLGGSDKQQYTKELALDEAYEENTSTQVVTDKTTSESRATVAKKSNPAPTTNANDLAEADKLFYSGKYKEALLHYQQRMQSPNAQVQGFATIRAAHCYVQLGERAKAKTLLELAIHSADSTVVVAARKAFSALQL